jgi:hypothetical protein
MTIPPAAPLVSVVIPNFNGASYLHECLVSVERQIYPRVEIVVVDNNSTDNSVETARLAAPDAQVLRQEKNLGFAGGVNAGIRTAKGDWIALLNNDAVAADDWISESMAAAARHPDASFLASRILQFDGGRIYSAGDCFLRAGIGYRRGQELEDREEYRQPSEVFSACGCAGFFRRDVFEELGGFDERFFAYLEDVEFGLRLQAAGRRGYYVPLAMVRHHGGVTGGGEFSPLSVRLRTRNSILLLVKSLPASLLFRWLPVIALAQVVWFIRATTHGRIFSALRGLVEVVPRVRDMMRERRLLRPYWRRHLPQLRGAIRRSEYLAGLDFVPSGAKSASWFLDWYFRILAPLRPGRDRADIHEGTSSPDPL